MKLPIFVIHLAILLVILSVFLLTGHAIAQTHPVDGNYITDWLVLGPFFPGDLKTDFLATVGGEAKVQPKEGDTVSTSDGKSLKWKRYTSKTKAINLIDAVGYYTDATAYAFCTLRSDAEGIADVYLGSNDGVAVWIDGKQAHQYTNPRSLTLDSDRFRVLLKAGVTPCLVKVSQASGEWEFAMRVSMLPQQKYATLSGTITDEAGQPIPNAAIRLEEEGIVVAQTHTDDSGNYQLIVYPLGGPYDLSATADDKGDWRLGIRLRERERQVFDFMLREAISISGTVLALDHRAPLVNVPLHAVVLGSGTPMGRAQFTITTLSDKAGKYRFINLKPGQYQVSCHIPGTDVYYMDGKNAAPTIPVEPGKTFKNVNFRLVPLKKEMQKAKKPYTDSASSTTMLPLKPLLETQTYTSKVGADAFRSALSDAQGYTWFTLVAGNAPYFYRFDGRQFTKIENTIGPSSTGVRDAEGKVWMAGQNGIVRLWNGRVEKHYTEQNGLPSNWVMTDRGIVYIHEENGEDKVSLVIDPKGLSLSGIKIDAAGGVWWWAIPSSDTSTVVHRLLKTPQGFSEALKIQLPFKVESASAVGEGLLLKGKDAPFIYYRADGIGHSLDSRLSRYLGMDSKGRLYFTVEVGNGLMQIIRDAPDGEGNFGYSASPMRFEFPIKLSTDYVDYDSVGQFRNEMWIFNWIADKPVFIIRENEILPAKNLYPSDLMDGGFFMTTDDETVWGRKWGKREVTELHFSKGMEYEVCALDVNALVPLQYNRKTGSYYFILHPSFTSPEPNIPLLVSYQNGKWKELFKFKSYPLSQTDTKGNTWIADLAKGSTRLLCITVDGELEQKSTQFEAFAPDDMGGCYLLGSNGTLRYYKEKKLTTYPPLGIEGIQDMAAFSDGSVYLYTGNVLYRWTPENFRQLTTMDGLPSGNLKRISKSLSKLFFYTTDGQIGWIEDGKVSVVDTERYPQLKNVTTAQPDETGRLFFYGTPNEEAPSREIWMLEAGKLRKLPLPDSHTSRGFKLISENDEMIVITYGDSKIYRYSLEHQQFYTLKNAGDFIGYIWGGYITEGNLIVSGWGKHFLKIDLKKAAPAFPKLSFQSIRVDKKSVEEQSHYTLGAGATLKASYVAIEKLSQNKVFYQTRLVGLDNNWSEPTKNESIEFYNPPVGSYRLEVRAKSDSELWGKPIGFDIEVKPPWYLAAVFLVPTASFSIILLAVSIISTTAFVKHRRQVLAYQRAAVQELQDARQMQLSLLPETAPHLEGIEIAGRCISANTVGGDFFDYLKSKNKNQMAIVIADVTGKGLKGAMNAVMTDGILRMATEEMKALSPAALLMKLNNVLKSSLEQDMNVTMVIGLINAETKTLTIANAGHHIHPIFIRNGELEFLKAKGLPLGVKAGIKYGEEQFALEEGSIVIFMTDGITEAKGRGEAFGSNASPLLYLESGRLEKTISQFDRNMPSEAMVEAIITDAMDFSGEKTTRDDDMTVVIAKVKVG